MKRDKLKDDDLLLCHREGELKYVAELYTHSEDVYNFLKEKLKKGSIRNYTHILVYELINKELGYPIPN